MKKSLLLIVMLSIVITNQTNAQSKVGIKGGLNLSKLTILNEPDNYTSPDMDYRTSFHIGGFWNIPLNEKLFVQPELQYSNKGVKSQGYTTKLPYLVLPVMIGFKPTELLQIEGGVELGYLLKYTAYHNDFDYGIDLGATFSITDEIKAGVRYNLGLNSIYGKEDLQFTDDNGNLIDQLILPHRVLQFSLYYDLIKM
uniref:Porin family protein n=1 Tax=Roseihalotalea indica TaxID=2867963 RepID=A0AA49GJR9_9BACT|nr:porin family protein [Tunicatimonas sp. TK19036]